MSAKCGARPYKSYGPQSNNAVAGCEGFNDMWEQFLRASEQFADEIKVGWCSVDCSEDGELCVAQGVQEYPAIRLYTQYDHVPPQDYRGEAQVTKLL